MEKTLLSERPNFFRLIQKKIRSLDKMDKPDETEARKIAQAMISVLPHQLRLFYENRRYAENIMNPHNLYLYKFWRSEIKQAGMKKSGKDLCECFREDTVGYFLCSYLQELGVDFCIEHDRITVCLSTTLQKFHG